MKDDDRELIPTQIHFAFNKRDPKTGRLELEVIENTKTSVRRFIEGQILDFLFNRGFKGLLLKELGLDTNKNLQVYRDVVGPFIDNPALKPGDLDLVIFDPAEPSKAIAIEAKCVKLKKEQDQSVLYTKEKNLTKGITQVNEYLRFGFHKTYLLVILLDEAHEDTKGLDIFKRSSLNESKKLLNPNVLANLDEKVGLLYLGVRQITEQSIHFNSVVDLMKLKEAVEVDQFNITTERILSLMSHNH